MGPWMYYAPLWVGTLVSACVALTGMKAFMDVWEGSIWLVIAVAAVVLLMCVWTGLSLQLLMIGVQGVFARVVPVPVGRSIRGGAAQGVGGLILGSYVIGSFAGVARLLPAQQMLILACSAASGLCLLAALVVYLTNAFGAVRDF